MRESFLHFLWQFQKYDALHLSTVDGLEVQIFSQGQLNTDAGPDFLNAKILIDDITWYGNVEMHLKSSDWNQHAHQNDAAYNNVILHVVWTHDQPVYRSDGQEVPVVELQNRVQKNLLKRCNELLKSPHTIPCQSMIDLVKKIDILSMLEQVCVYRLEQKSDVILEMLQKNSGSWEETAYQLLARNFGFKTNSEPFEKLSKTLPHKILIKYANSPVQLEALLFGMAGFLPSHAEEEYALDLNKEFQYLSKKHGLQNQNLLKVEWKFLRMRPGNFPTVRLAQFASFIRHNEKFFQEFIHFNQVRDLKELWGHSLSTYWTNHYDFGKIASKKNSGIGSASIEVLLINTVAPILAAYARQTNNDQYMEKAIDLLMALKSEKNHIINEWSDLGIQSKNAFDSQALIGLRNDFCLKNKCLSCKIGVSLINR